MSEFCIADAEHYWRRCTKCGAVCGGRTPTCDQRASCRRAATCQLGRLQVQLVAWALGDLDALEALPL